MDLTLKGLKYVTVGFLMALVISMRSFGSGGPAEVEGVVKKDATWAGEVLVVGDVLVPEGVTLTVAPGAKVMFSSSESSKIEPAFLSMQTEIMVRGTLVVRGEPGRPVSFGPAPEQFNGKRPERGDWGGVIFDGRDASKSSLSNARFVMADAGISAYNSSPAVTGCRVEDCRYGLVFMGASRPAVTGSVISGCEFGVVAARGAKPAMKGCVLEKNGRDYILRD